MTAFLRTSAVLICLSTLLNTPLLHADEPAMNAVELLAAFSSDRAGQYEEVFQFAESGRIISAEIHAVGMNDTTAKYSGQEHAWYEVNNILRIKTADGYEGVSGVDTYHAGDFSDAHLLELQEVMDDVAAYRSLDPVVVSTMLDKMQPAVSDTVRASIDIALWDLAARKAGRPLHKLLGAQRDSIEAYASLPFYETLPEYIDAVREYAKLGFTVFKFHVWGSIEEDLRLVKLVQETFAESPYRFMVDLESVYDLEDALRLGRQMEKALFLWFEAPVDDENLAAYAALRTRLPMPIIPAGYNIYSPEFIRQGIETGAWDAGRFDSTVVGGISPALTLLVIANEADLTIDIQSWGHSLAQAANLHLMLANARTPYFEAPMPKGIFEFGMKNGSLVSGGRAAAPDGPGLGIEVDWISLKTADFYAHTVLEFPSASNESEQVQ